MISTIENYKKIIPEMQKEFDIQNIHAVPKISKISLSFNLSSMGNDKKIVDSVFNDMLIITGSLPVIKNATFSNANFKIREGQPLVVICTLRGKKIFHFLDRLIYSALPRLRDFKGLKKSFDKAGNLSFTIPGQSAIMYECNFTNDLNIALSVSCSDSKKTEFLLSKINIPFI